MCFETFPAEPLEGGRGLLEASGNGWRPLEPAGATRRELQVTGGAHSSLLQKAGKFLRDAASDNIA